MKKWFDSITSSALDMTDISKTTYIYEADFNNAFNTVSKFTKLNNKWGELLEILHENHPIMELHNGDVDTQVIIVPEQNKIFVKEYFYFTLVGETREEFHLYFIYLYLTTNHLCSDVDIDLFQLSETFVVNRMNAITSEEITAIGFDTIDFRSSHIRALIFLSLMVNNPTSKVSILERKMIRDTIGSSYAKRILGLDEDAYAYIEKKDLYKSDKDEERNKFYTVKQEFERQKIDFDDYAHKILKEKRMILWIWWTISPFVSADIAILLPMLYETKKIKKIYIDLCVESDGVLQAYVNGADIPEETVEKEIRKIYPPVIKDFQKETLPYMVLLNKMRELEIPLECFGLSGTELLEIEPIMKQGNKVEYLVDPLWKKLIAKEYSNFTSNDDDDLTIFFYYMKPMYPVPLRLKDSRIEKIIHTDKFTGYGPEKPENGLAIYSHYCSSSERSFVIPAIAETSLNKEIVVHYPYIESHKESPSLDDQSFNRFSLYDTMVYSSHSGGGGRGRKNNDLVPQDFSFQPVSNRN